MKSITVGLFAWVKAAADHLEAKRIEWRRERQRNDLRSRAFALDAQLHEARRYVERDRSIERKERDRMVRQLDAARERLEEFETLLRAYITGQRLIDSSTVQSAAAKARESLTSGFGDLPNE